MKSEPMLDRLPGGLRIKYRDLAGYQIVDRAITADQEGITVRLFMSSGTMDVLDLTGDITLWLEDTFFGVLDDYSRDQLTQIGVTVDA